MRIAGGKLTYSATDLTSHFECKHKTFRELRVARREEDRPWTSEIERQILEQRGRTHETRVLRFYETSGLTVVDLKPPPLTDAAAEKLHAETLAVMQRGPDVIYQATLVAGDWVGRPDFLLKTARASSSTGHCYEPLDAKLARDEQARAILQLCVYADLLEQIQGTRPEKLWLALGHEEIEPIGRRTDDYFAYYLQSKANLEGFLSTQVAQDPYPEPCEHCDICAWWKDCADRRRNDDHLSLVAGITRRQRTKLAAEGVTQLVQLGALPVGRGIKDLEGEPLTRIREQAALQAKSRNTGKPEFELLLDCDPGAGLAALPRPRPGDLFLDLEGDAFVRQGGLEYLFGLLELGQAEFDFTSRKVAGPPKYLHWWATNPLEEKAAFEGLMNRIFQGLEEFPDLHVFHFGHRENNALKVLSCRHGVREDQVDQLLRRGTLIDLHAVVKHGLRASVETYSLKELERFHDFERTIGLRDAARAMQLFGWWLETKDPAIDVSELRKTILAYNEDDCRSTWKLLEWLEKRRVDLEQRLGRSIPRPEPEQEDPNEKIEERDQEVADLVKALLRGIPTDTDELTDEQRARRLLSDLLGWHWRELKSGYWEYHEGRRAPPSEWLTHRFVLANLHYEGTVGKVVQSDIHRYTFPEQEHSIRTTPKPVDAETLKPVRVHRLGPGFVELLRGKAARDKHPLALKVGKPLSMNDQQRRLFDVARSIATHGLQDRTEFGAARDLLSRFPPRCGQPAGASLASDEEEAVVAIARLATALDHSCLPIQGPPGSGKSTAGAHAIIALIRAGKKVGVTANSHQVIVELLTKVATLAKETDGVRGLHMCDEDRFEDLPFPKSKDYSDVAASLGSGALNLVGGTSFAWCLECFTGALDVLFVDEASQMSLANALAVSTAAESLVLLGDPAQLDQPQKGVHPAGADVSALEHVLGIEDLTMPPDRGVFLGTTRRLHPDICAFTSQVFYESRLHSLEGLEKQCITGPAPFDGAGLRFVSVAHDGNTSHSPEEVQTVDKIVSTLLGGSYAFTDAGGATRPLTADDILVVAPYNAHVTALRLRLPDQVQVGTVDKFQGKERPIVIYSMATSSGEEAPRGLEFLYSLNRLNVATSRAKALVILVANPELTKARCRTPRQLQLVNALCTYLRLSAVVT
jgi:predicted RecB family nuclease